MAKTRQSIREKIKTIDGAIEHCRRLLNNETIVLGGIHKISITRGKTTDEQLLTTIESLMTDRIKFSGKINSFID